MTEPSTHGFERMKIREDKAPSILWSQRGVRVDANDGPGGVIWVNIRQPDGTVYVLALGTDGQVHVGHHASDREAAYLAAKELLTAVPTAQGS